MVIYKISFFQGFHIFKIFYRRKKFDPLKKPAMEEVLLSKILRFCFLQ